MDKRCTIIMLLLLCLGSLRGDFNGLSDLDQYSQFHPEHVESENDNWGNPFFVNFYKEHFCEPFFVRAWKSIKRLFGFAVPVDWNANQFASLLKKVSEQRVKLGYNYRDTKQIKLKEGDRCFVWGDLHGSYHSLVRDLFEVKRMGAIGEDLTITEDNVYFVFLGDVIDRSPYSLEVLHTILLLMERNPEKVLYLRGKHEDDSYWEGCSLRRALKYRLSSWDTGGLASIPLGGEINTFFSTLPLSLSFVHEKSNEKIHCAHGLEKQVLRDDPSIVLVLFGEDRFATEQNVWGNRFVGSVGNAACWSLVSCPSTTYQHFFEFYRDSFAELVIGPSMSQSVLTAVGRDVRRNEGFEHTHLSPIFGYKLQKQANSLEGKDILKVGCSAGISGVFGPKGNEVVTGIHAALHNFNKESNERLVRLVLFDDSYVPRKAFSNVRALYNDYGVSILLSPTGTPTVSFYSNIIKTDRVAVAFPSSGAGMFRSSDFYNMVHFRASYPQEIRFGLEYLVSRYGAAKFAFFYQDDELGRPMVEFAHKELERNGITTWLDLPHAKTDSIFTDQIEKTKKFVPDVICCFSSHFPTVEFVAQLGAESFLGKVLYSVSPLNSEAFDSFLRERGIKSMQTFPLPHPAMSEMDIAKEYLDAIGKFGYHPDTNSFEGYVATALFVDAVKNVKWPVTKGKIISYFEEMKDHDFKGLRLNFDKKTRQLTNSVWLKTPRGQWLSREVEI